jgi:hypothetical protein
LRRKLWQIFGRTACQLRSRQAGAEAKAKAPAIADASAWRRAECRSWLRSLKLRSAIKNNREYGRQVRRQFGVDTTVNALQVARLYGGRPEIVSRLSWNALVTLSSPTFHATARETLEARIIAGETLGAPEIGAARGALKAGRRGRQP